MKKIFLLAFALPFAGILTACGQRAYENKEVKEFAAMLADDKVQLVDVRTPQEFEEGHLAEARNIDFKAEDFMERATAVLDKARPVAVYCRSGRRSAMAAEKLAEQGYRVTNLVGGILAWEAAHMPTAGTYETDAFHTPHGGLVEFHALMHASVRMVADGKEVMVDPVSRLDDRTIDYTQLPKADYILVTHEHFDHLDAEAIKALTKEGTRLITNARCADMLKKGEVMANGDVLLTDLMKIEAVPAYNTTEGRTQFHPKGRDNGFVLTVDSLRIYIAGDTEDIPEMDMIKDIDIAFLPCNQPYTMTPEQLIRAARIIKPKVLFPYHYGDTDLSAVPDALAPDAIDVRIKESYR